MLTKRFVGEAMPHLTIEYSEGEDRPLDMSALSRALHAALIKSKIFPVAGIRIRAYRADFAIVADGLPESGFVAMTLSVGAGRTMAELRAGGDALFSVAQAELAEPLSSPHFALSLEIRQIDAELSWKDTPIHARLSS